MRLRTRLTVALSVAMAATMATAFFAVSFVVTRSEEKQLDEALRAEARGEALEIARQAGSDIHLIGRPGPDDDASQLAKYAAIYDDDTGRVVEASPGFAPPVYASVKHPRGVPFDLGLPGESLRAVFAVVPGHPTVRLILAAPLTELERDRAYLRQVMSVAALASLLLIIAVTWPIVRGLTRDHEAIAAAVRRVAGGDLRARVALRSGDRETARLARDIDEMISRLSILMDSQQRFLANAAHELRSPLTALYGELQLALRRPRDNEGYRAAIEEALDATVRLKALAEDLLALARLGGERERKTTPSPLTDLIEGAAALARVEAKRRGVRIELDVDGSTVTGHAGDLERMVRNLIENAVRHTPDGTAVKVHAHTAGDRVLVAVSDEGPGVKAEERERIFEPFFRGAAERASGVGSGLGLAIVREIARAHDGDVTVDAGPATGTGARFVAWLPTVTPDA